MSAAASLAQAEGGASRTVRVFISSTFRDFAEERNLLVRRVFPELRRRAREREVEVVDVDLRWGITEAEAERGETLSICLQEIDRCRPFFIGLLGERYGWQPEAGRYPEVLLERLPWLREHQGGTSVTELEILHGVLKDPGMSGLAFFYLRDPAWSAARGADFASESEDARARLARLKARIRESGFPVVEDYASPQAVAERILEDLWSRIDARFPASEVSDEHEQERRRHEAFAQTRRSLYVGGESAVSGLLAHLDGASDEASDAARDEASDGASHEKGDERSAAATESARDDDSAAVTEAASVAARSTAPGKAGTGRGKSALNSRIAVVTGESGCGKSALLANAMAQLRASRPQDLVFEHYLGSASDAGNADAIARRLCREVIRRERVSRGEDPNKAGDKAGDESGMAGGGSGLGRAGLGEMGGGLGSGLGGVDESGEQKTPRDADGLAVDSDKLFEELPEYLARGAALARQQGGRFVVVLDALDKLSSQPDASWLPRQVPPGVRLVLSTLEGPALATARDRAWPIETASRLTPQSARQLVVESLERFNKRLPETLLDAIASHGLATLPIFLRVLTDELRVFGSHEELPARLSGYLACGSVESLHEQVLARVEGDLEREGGRVEDLAGVLTALWASRRGLSEAEVVELAGVTRVTWSRVSLALDESLFEQSGRWTFSHDYLRKAVAARYLPTESQERAKHAALARWWDARLREGLGKAIVDFVPVDPTDADESADDAPDREPSDDALVDRAIDELPWQWEQAQSWGDLADCLLDPLSGPEIVMRVSDQQIFRWWQALGDHRGLKAEVEYERVWEVWSSQQSRRRWSANREPLDRLASLLGRLAPFLLPKNGGSGSLRRVFWHAHLTIDRQLSFPRSWTIGSILLAVVSAVALWWWFGHMVFAITVGIGIATILIAGAYLDGIKSGRGWMHEPDDPFRSTSLRLLEIIVQAARSDVEAGRELTPDEVAIERACRARLDHWNASTQSWSVQAQVDRMRNLAARARRYPKGWDAWRLRKAIARLTAEYYAGRRVEQTPALATAVSDGGWQVAQALAAYGATEDAERLCRNIAALCGQAYRATGSDQAADLLARAHEKLGDALSECNQHDLAVEQYQLEVKVLTRSRRSDRRRLATRTANVGSALAALGRHDEALRAYFAAIRAGMNPSRCDDWSPADIWYEVAKVFRIKEEVSDALEAEHSCYRAHIADANTDGARRAAFRISTLHAKLGDAESALEWQRRSANIDTTSRKRSGVHVRAERLGDPIQRAGQNTQACRVASVRDQLPRAVSVNRGARTMPCDSKRRVLVVLWAIVVFGLGGFGLVSVVVECVGYAGGSR